MGTSQTVIGRLERGDRSPSVKTLRKMAEVTGSRLVIRLDGPEADQPSR
jgi:transcriptional regulator with XRE-family HTH domain